MPQTDMNFEGRRRGTLCNTCRANGLVNGQAPGTGLVNGAAAHNGYRATATRISESTPAGTPNGTKPQCMVNGYINHGHKGKRTKAALPRTLGKQGSAISAVTYPSAAGRVIRRDSPRCISVNGAASLDTVAVPNNSGQMAPERSAPSPAAKNQRRKKKFRHKKRETEVVCPENSTLPLVPPQEEEDWENEVQEITVTDWEKLCFGVQPYGPEDVLHFSLRDLTLKQTDRVALLVRANYSPAARHPRPVKWTCYNIPTEPDQFADADE
ncbi:uncharacterized protein LOC111650952 [Seriola lalandi dorsalis]|uniref:uncharacterized protein LOC111650952 n=1 Tax=Seriola lalandi dorsalis TaxID=1841481 RepID=UPI000C6FC272|nr:uncharacterized protein LOC111650952 [Seriola lalandi dorsalis]XP_056228284.1 uncharacterized protein LOC130166616 [Seriola aureovittata]